MRSGRSELGFLFKRRPCLGMMIFNHRWVLVFTVRHHTACSLNTHMHKHKDAMPNVLFKISWAASAWHVYVSTLCLCMCLNVCLLAFLCVQRCRLSHSSGLISCWIMHCNGHKQKHSEEEEGLSFLFICFDSSLDISVDLVFEVA